jgi:hypothetical protein
VSDVLFGPSWDLRVVDEADTRAVLVALAGGVALDVGVRSGVASVGGSLMVLVSTAALLSSGRLRTRASAACLATATVLGAFLTIRSSAPLLAIDLLAAAAAIGLAGLLAREGKLSDLPARVLASRAALAAAHAVATVPFLAVPLRRALSARRGLRCSAAVRGVMIALPIIVVLGALLASADVVFASAIRVEVPVPEDAVGHAALVVVGALALGGVLRVASSSAHDVAAPVARIGVVEWTIVLGGVVALLGAFAVSQLVTVAGGARHVLETEGLTYAEYARRGYGQLLAVVVLTGLVLAALRTFAAERSSRRFVWMAEALVALTAVVLVIAIRKLGLYEDAYGWTMLRLLAKAGAVWIMAVLALTAVRVAGVRRDVDWLVPASLAAGVLVLLTLNVMNPEATIARHNLDMTREVDARYLVDLSDDAVPAIVDALPGLEPGARSAVVSQLCSTPSDGDRGVLAWNAARAAAEDARDEIC